MLSIDQLFMCVIGQYMWHLTLNNRSSCMHIHMFFVYIHSSCPRSFPGLTCNKTMFILQENKHGFVTSEPGKWETPVSPYNLIVALYRFHCIWKTKHLRHYVPYRIGLPEADEALRERKCMSCEVDDCEYVSAYFSASTEYYVLNCLGPAVPTYSIRNTKGETGMGRMSTYWILLMSPSSYGPFQESSVSWPTVGSTSGR